MADEITKDLEEFREALTRINRSFKLNIPLNTAVTIERRQLDILYSMLNNAREAVKNNISFEEYIKKNLNVVIEKYFYEFSKDLGVFNNLEEPDEALNNLLSGRVDTNGSKIMILLIQGLARAYAKAYEDIKGVVKRIDFRCPICGNESDVIVKWTDGSYRMICPFCGYTWIISTGELVCPKCGNKDPFSLGIFADRDRRIGLFICQECKFTAKIILDPRLISRYPRILLPLIALNGEKYRSFLSKI